MLIERAAVLQEDQPGQPSPNRWMAAAALALAGLGGLAWGGPIMVRMIADVDFPFHIATAESFAATGQITMPHFLLQVLLGGVVATGLAMPRQAALVFFCALYAATAAVTCWYIARRSASAAGWIAGVLLAIAVLMSAPILPSGELELFLIGYFPPNVYHNPTMLVAKPFLVLSLASAVAALTRTGRATGRELFLLTAPVVLLGFAKPNYLGCLVPAVAAAAVWKLAAARRAGDLHGARGPAAAGVVSWPRVVAVCAAGVLTVAATLALYGTLAVGEGAGVTLAPLAVIGHYSPVDFDTIVGSLLASLAFPLVVTALWPQLAWRDAAMRVAWLGTFAGLLISYFLAEAGDRMYDGNFLWTGQMAVFVLFVASAAFVGANLAGRGRTSAPMALQLVRAVAIGAVLWLHVQSGIRHAEVKVEPSRWLAFWT
jgi:hypothetical protein